MRPNRIVKSNIWDISKSAFNFSIFFFLILISILVASQEVQAQPELDVTKTQFQDPTCPVEVGTELTIEYTVVVANTGDMEATDVEMVDFLPGLNGQQVTLVPGSLMDNIGCVAGTVNGAVVIFCDDFPLPAGDTETITYMVTITPNLQGVISNVAGAQFGGTPGTCFVTENFCFSDVNCPDNECVFNSELDKLEGIGKCDFDPMMDCEDTSECPQTNVCGGGMPGMIDNSTPVTCEVTAMSDVSIVKSSPTNPPGTCIVPNQDNNVTFDITIVNDGTANASDVDVMDQLPPGFDFVSVSPEDDCFEGEIDDLVICIFDNLAPNGGNQVITIMTTINPDPDQQSTDPNQATIDFTDDGNGATVNIASNQVFICIDSDCSEFFNGQFSGHGGREIHRA